jgi:hypothetical protein
VQSIAFETNSYPERLFPLTVTFMYTTTADDLSVPHVSGHHHIPYITGNKTNPQPVGAPIYIYFAIWAEVMLIKDYAWRYKP